MDVKIHVGEELVAVFQLIHVANGVPTSKYNSSKSKA